MKKKRAAKPRENGDASQTLNPAHNPTHSLFVALNGLHIACSNAHLFQELADRRQQAKEMYLGLLNAAQQASPKVLSVLPKLSKPDESLEYRQQLRKVLDQTAEWCTRSKDALRAGGADEWVERTTNNSNGQSRAIELHTKLSETDSVLLGLRLGIDNSNLLIRDAANSMADMGTWFKHARDELQAILETPKPKRTTRSRRPTPSIDEKVAIVGARLKKQREGALLGSAAGPREAARQLKVHPGTISRWMRSEGLSCSRDRKPSARVVDGHDDGLKLKQRRRQKP